jgi:hypothetical protein
MRVLSYVFLIAALVPLQIVLMPYMSFGDVKPDMGLIAVCLAGLLGGELEGLLVGLAIGWVLSLFSAEDLASSMLVKGGVGLVSGIAGRQVAHITPLVVMLGFLVASGAAGLVTAGLLPLNDAQDMWWALGAVVLPQACFDAVVGGTIYWLAWGRFNIERVALDQRI